MLLNTKQFVSTLGFTVQQSVHVTTPWLGLFVFVLQLAVAVYALISVFHDLL